MDTKSFFDLKLIVQAEILGSLGWDSPITTITLLSYAGWKLKTKVLASHLILGVNHHMSGKINPH